MPEIQTTIVAIVAIIDGDKYEDFLPQGTEYNSWSAGYWQPSVQTNFANNILSSKSVGPLAGAPGSRFLWLSSSVQQY